ncbi:hypothetical protein BLOT_006717 [Blomia tropicalis]|nr:hypothetical protein BLOT_006717 [Blomia tropicalis]
MTTHSIGHPNFVGHRLPSLRWNGMNRKSMPHYLHMDRVLPNFPIDLKRGWWRRLMSIEIVVYVCIDTN